MNEEKMICSHSENLPVTDIRKLKEMYRKIKNR